MDGSIKWWGQTQKRVSLTICNSPSWYISSASVMTETKSLSSRERVKIGTHFHADLVPSWLKSKVAEDDALRSHHCHVVSLAVVVLRL